MKNKPGTMAARALSAFLSAAMLLTSLPMTAFASEQSPAADTQEENVQQIISENDATVIQDTIEELQDEDFIWPEDTFDWFSYDWKSATDEDLDDHLLSSDHVNTRDFLLSLSEDETEEILSRDTSLTGHYTQFVGEPEAEEGTPQEWDTYYDYLVSIPQTLKWTAKNDISNSNVYMTINVYNGSTKVNSLTITYTNIKSKVGAGGKSSTRYTGLTVGAVEENTGSPFRCYLTDGGTATWKNGTSAKSWEIVCLHLATTKPVGYSFSYNRKTVDYNNDGEETDPLIKYVTKESYTKDDTNKALSGGTTLPANNTTASSATITTSLLVNLKHFGIHTGRGSMHQVSQFIYTPVTYYVTYDGGSTQPCVYGGAYNRLTKQPDRTGQYTVYFEDSPHNSESQQKAAWSQTWLNWKYGNSTYAAGSSFSNLANTSTTINYVSNYAAVVVNAITPPTPEAYGGYNFIGWGDANGNLIVKKGQNYTPSKDTILYAQYGDPDTYTITVDGAGGILDYARAGYSGLHDEKLSGTITSAQYIWYEKSSGRINVPMSGSDTTIKSPSRKGYSFTGWNYADCTMVEDGSSTTYYQMRKDGSIKATWSPKTYRISYDANGGTVNPGYNDIVYDTACPDAPTPTRVGYTFAAWEPKEEDMQYSGIYNCDRDSEVIANWNPNHFTIKFNLDGGLYDGRSTIEDIQMYYEQENELGVIPHAPEKEGYTFKGWVDSKGNSYESESKIPTTLCKDEGDIVTIKATWEKNPDPVVVVIDDEGNNKPAQVDPELKEMIMELLGKVKKLSEMSTDQVSKLMDALTSQYFLSKAQAKTLFDLINNNNALTEEQKIALLKALAEGTLTEEQKSLLIAMISKSPLSDADKKALLAAIGGISSLSQEQQKKILEALEKGSSAEIKMNGVTYILTKTKDGTISVSIKSLDGVKDVVIPDFITVAGKTYPITEIAPGAFKGNKDVNTVTMGDNISTIGESAFEGAKNLKSIVFSEHLKEIGPKAFKDCTSLGKDVTLPASLQTIGASAFEGCTKLEKIIIKDPSKLLEIGKKAFYNTALKSFKVPKSVLKIQDGAFAANKKMTGFTFEKGSALVSLGKGVWEKDVKLKSVKLPSKIAKIPAKTFKGCKALKSAKLSSGTTDIGTSAFEGCTALKSITIPSKVINIGKKAFYGDKKLGKVTFKGKILSKVGSKAFKKCKKAIVFRCPKSKLGAYKKKLKGKY